MQTRFVLPAFIAVILLAGCATPDTANVSLPKSTGHVRMDFWRFDGPPPAASPAHVPLVHSMPAPSPSPPETAWFRVEDNVKVLNGPCIRGEKKWWQDPAYRAWLALIECRFAGEPSQPAASTIDTVVPSTTTAGSTVRYYWRPARFLFSPAEVGRPCPPGTVEQEVYHYRDARGGTHQKWRCIDP